MPRDLDFNLHSHTFRCGHAEGGDEDYVLAAINAGFTHLGFSDHVFLPGIYAPRMRGDISFLNEYITSVRNLKKEYQGKIDIHLGFEAEYMPEFVSYYKDLLDSGKIDYLIMGQHCFYKGGKTHWYSKDCTLEEAVKHYTDDVIEGMRSELFLYVAHPDFFMIYGAGFQDCHREAAYRIAREAKRLGIPLEVNVSQGRRFEKGGFDPMALETYPYPPFWEIVAEVGCDVVLGVDAHTPEHYRTTDYDYFFEMIDRLGLHLIKHCPLD